MGAIEVTQKIRMFAGEKHRERVVTPEEEARYLAAAPELLSSIVTVLSTLGCDRMNVAGCAWKRSRGSTAAMERSS